MQAITGGKRQILVVGVAEPIDRDGVDPQHELVEVAGEPVGRQQDEPDRDPGEEDDRARATTYGRDQRSLVGGRTQRVRRGRTPSTARRTRRPRRPRRSRTPYFRTASAIASVLSNSRSIWLS